MIAALRPWFSLVRFGHSVFALPFALTSAWLAGRGRPDTRVLLWVLLCCVAARTAAMGFNRLVDRHLDARNPRTAGRELPRGVLRPAGVAALVVLSSAVFVGGAFALNAPCGWLSLPVLAVLLAYSLMKRFSALSHLVLGLGLALAPLGAWLAVRGDFSGDLSAPLLLAAGVLTWVAGFDLIYACQDEAFDRAAGLCSIPARLGTARALQLSIVLHGVTLCCLVLFAWRADMGLPFGVALLASAVLLGWQHALVSPRDLSRANLAFFTLNGWVAVGLFLGTVLDLGLRGGSA